MPMNIIKLLCKIAQALILFCIVFGASCSKENPNNVPPVSPDAPDIPVPPDMPGPDVRSEEERTLSKNVISGGFSSLDSTSITLTWSEPSNTNFSKVLILRSESSISDAPTTGQIYASGVSIGASSVVYNSSETTFIDSGAIGSTHYFYKLFAYDMSFNYASGVEISGGGSKADHDEDGLIEIYTAEMLNNMRYNLAGTSYRSVKNGASHSEGCPSGGCNGYELTANIDLLSLLDNNGNGMIDTMPIPVDKNTDGDTDDVGERITVIDTNMDTSWIPIGVVGGVGKSFTGTFDGNNHTIANLWVNEPTEDAGLFSVVDGGMSGTVQIRNVEIISGSIYANRLGGHVNADFMGGLVGRVFGSLTISECTFSGSGGVFSFSEQSRSGGLVGGVSPISDTSLVIINSIFSGSAGVSSYSSKSTTSPGGFYVGSGGLVGYSANSLVIMNSYVSGSGDISSYTKVLHSTSGGLVGASKAPLTIMNSYFNGSGEIFSYSNDIHVGSYSGGLVGYSEDTLTIMNSYFSGSGKISFVSIFVGGFHLGGLIGKNANIISITNSYWNTDTPQSVNGRERTLQDKKAQGNAETNPSGATGLTLAQLKNITGMHPDGLGSAWDLGTNMQLPAIKLCVSPITDGVCASYDTLLPGQR